MVKDVDSRPTFEVDGRAFSTLDGFYDEFTRAVIPGVDWGRNLDALVDVLRGSMGTPESGFILVWRNSSKSRVDLGHPETVRQLESRLARCHPTNRASIGRELERARQHQGETVFDWLVAIFKARHDVTVVYE